MGTRGNNVILDGAAGGFVLAGQERRRAGGKSAGMSAPSPALPYVVGAFQHVLDPPGQRAAREQRPEEQWYINDHCFVAGPDGRLHWFGITNPYPADRNLYGPGSHRHLGHASAPAPFGPWEEHPHVVALPEGTADNIGASFAIRQGEDYYLFAGYSGGLSTSRSRDLFAWERPMTPGPQLGGSMRDPCIVELDDGTCLLYVCMGEGGYSVVGLAESADLVTWQPLPPALLTDVAVSWGALESPFVHRRGDLYYLFLNHSHRQYSETLVFASADPRHFDWERPLTTLFTHAGEIFTREGRTYLSHCGIEDRHWSDTGAPYGLWLAELGWAEP